MNISIAIISILCFNGSTMQIHEEDQGVLQEDWSQGRQEVQAQDHCGATAEDAISTKKRPRTRRKNDLAEPPHDPPNGAAWVQLTKGAWCLIDSEDSERVLRHEWMLETGGYAAKGQVLPNGTYGKMYMHYFLMSPTEGFEVDHRFGNRLDNRKSMLRIATRQQQCSSK